MANPKRKLWLIASLCTILFPLLNVGCGEGDFAGSVVAEANKSNIQRVANCYAMYQMAHGSTDFKGPKDLEEFKKFLNDPAYGESVKAMKVDIANLDALFVSERDKEPFKIRFAAPGSSRGSNEPVVFETTGVGGSRQVAFTSSKVKDVTDSAEYDQMFAGKYASDSPSRATSGAAPSDAADVGKSKSGG